MLRVVAGVVILSLAACANETPLVETKGDCADVYTGKVCTYAVAQGENVVTAGAVISLAAIENSPAGHEHMDWPPKALLTTQLPEQGTKASGLVEMNMYWEGKGHPPAPYMIPHYDFHFYLIPDADVKAIDCKDTTKPAALAAGYALPDIDLPPADQKMMGFEKLVGICVPQMGMHSLLQSEIESTTPFRGTMVIGYYHGKPIFIEPMISRDMLLEKKSFTLPVPEIPGLTGPHPTSFNATYDAVSNAYKFEWGGFKS